MNEPMQHDMPRIDLRREDWRPGGSRGDELLPGAEAVSGYRQGRQGGLEQGTRRLALFAGGIGGVLVVFVGLWSVTHHHGGPVPVIQADSKPVRVKPVHPGGMQVSGSDDGILSGQVAEGHEALAPPPEVPEPARLAPPPVPARPPESSLSAPLAPSAPPAPAPAEMAPERVEHAAAAKPVSPKPHMAAGHAEVQLAAVGSEEAAKSEWERLARRMPGLLDGRHLHLSRTERNGHTYWRVRTGGFTDSARAAEFCGQVRAKGSGCSVASF